MDINKLSICYLRQELYLAIGLFLIALLVMRVWFLDDLLTPTIIATVFTLVVSAAIGMIWRRIAKSSPESLPTFFTAVSGFRMLLALAVMFIYYLVFGRSAMLLFIVVFLVFYFVSLAHHSIFFARVSNRS